jgi:hypothetical protein
MKKQLRTIMETFSDVSDEAKSAGLEAAVRVLAAGKK